MDGRAGNVSRPRGHIMPQTKMVTQSEERRRPKPAFETPGPDSSLHHYQSDSIISLIIIQRTRMTSKNSSEPASHIPMHPLSFQVLLVLMEGELHGYGIAKAIEEKDAHLGQIYPTNLYRRLRDMAESGLIDEQRSKDDDGNHRSTFSITTLGHQVAAEEAHRLEGMVVDARRHKLLAPRPGQ